MEMQGEVRCAHVADCTDIEFEKEEFASRARLVLARRPVRARGQGVESVKSLAPRDVTSTSRRKSQHAWARADSVHTTRHDRNEASFA